MRETEEPTASGVNQHNTEVITWPTPVVRYNYRLGVPEPGFYREIINTDGETYGGSNVGNFGGVQSEAREWMGREHSIMIHLPPLATVALRLEK